MTHEEKFQKETGKPIYIIESSGCQHAGHSITSARGVTNPEFIPYLKSSLDKKEELLREALYLIKLSLPSYPIAYDGRYRQLISKIEEVIK